MQQATNAAISGAIGSSGSGTPLASRKRKSEEHLGSVTRDQSVHGTGKFQQVFFGRLLQPRDVKEICSLLVVLSQEAIEALSGKGDRQLERENNHNSKLLLLHSFKGRKIV